MFKSLKKNNKGVTLVELLTALAILGIVITVAFSLFFFGNNVFAKGTSQYNVQTDLRFANDYIVREVKYATEIELSSTSPGSIADSDPYDYIYFDGDSIRHSKYNSGGSRVIEDVVTPVLSSSYFGTKVNNYSQMLDISLYGQERDQLYDLNTSITLPNININKNYFGDSSNMKTIKYIVNTTLAPPSTPPEGGGDGDDGSVDPPQTFVEASVVINTSANKTYRVTLGGTVQETTGNKSPYSVSYTVLGNSSYPLKVEDISNSNNIKTIFDGTFDVSGVDITKEI